jgi:hypothetical protein
MPSSHRRRAIAQNRTASPGPANDAIIVDASPSPLPPLVLPAGDAILGATQLPTVCEFLYFFLITHEFSQPRYAISLQPISQTRRLPPRRRANMGIDTSSALISSSSNPQVPQSQFSQLDKYKAPLRREQPRSCAVYRYPARVGGVDRRRPNEYAECRPETSRRVRLKVLV